MSGFGQWRVHTSVNLSSTLIRRANVRCRERVGGLHIRGSAE